jgi:hypothetical protein
MRTPLFCVFESGNFPHNNNSLGLQKCYLYHTEFKFFEFDHTLSLATLTLSLNWISYEKIFWLKLAIKQNLRMALAIIVTEVRLISKSIVGQNLTATICHILNCGGNVRI